MQKANNSFKETNINLGVGEGNVIKNAYSVKAKAKFAPVSAFCINGCGLIQVRQDGTCPACHTVIVRRNTWDSVIKRFDHVISKNKEAIENYIPTDFANFELSQIPIMIGHNHYAVHMKFLTEFVNIKHVDQEFRDYGKFFNMIQSTCPIVKL